MSDVIDLRFLGEQVRVLQRDMAMVKARLAELPTLSQFEAGLTEIDRQFHAMGEVIAEKVTVAIGGHLDRIAGELRSIAARLDKLEQR